MHWEVNDYRKRPPTPSWTEWQVPLTKKWDYIFKISFWCVLFPFILFGGIFAPPTLLFQVVLLDYFIYMAYKTEGAI